MVMKQCPKCEQQIPVACKTCLCGHLFISNRRPSNSGKNGSTNKNAPNDNETDVKRRRTERTKRERPDYYNAIEIENHMKKVNKPISSASSTSSSTGNNNNSNKNNKDNDNTKNNTNIIKATKEVPSPSNSIIINSSSSCNNNNNINNNNNNATSSSDGNSVEESPGRKRRGRPNKSQLGKPKIPENTERYLEREEDVFLNVTPEKALQYSVILAEINRKLCHQQFKI